jgi:hypothetical protein
VVLPSAHGPAMLLSTSGTNGVEMDSEGNRRGGYTPRPVEQKPAHLSARPQTERCGLSDEASMAVYNQPRNLRCSILGVQEVPVA